MFVVPLFGGLENAGANLSPDVEIPQSWVRIPNGKARIHSIPLRLSGYVWQPFAEVALGIRFGDLVHEQSHRNLVYRGCAPQTADFLAAHGFERLCSGMEAIMALADTAWERPTIRSLARRGLRFGYAEEFLGNINDAAVKTAVLFEHSRYAERPKLRYLFRLTPDPTTRCFYFRDNSGEWLAAITLSVKNPRHIATELLLRHADAPVGVMEALVSATARILVDEGFDYWNLGEVPFYGATAPANRFSSLYAMTRRCIRFAYNYRGLFAFKDKFRPHWRPVYLCARPRITLILLADMMFTSGFMRLVAKVAADLPQQLLSSFGILKKR